MLVLVVWVVLAAVTAGVLALFFEGSRRGHERERAALLWTEVVTEISRTGIPDDAFAAVRAHFDEEELVALTMGVIAING